MVFFTCNSCGESLKKSHVEKHCMSKCRNCEMLSCVDCGKDFWGEEYKIHIKCISEEEKYSGKDFKAKPNKGEAKQESWIELIQTTINTASNLAPDLVHFLEQLVTFTNVPRKQAKFENYVLNSMNIRNKNLVSRAWEIFNSAQKSAAKKNTENLATSTKAGEEPAKDKDDAKSEKKKKKSKAAEAETQQEVSTIIAKEITNDDNSSSVKKKSKKRKQSAEIEDAENAQTEGEKKRKSNVDADESITNNASGKVLENPLDGSGVEPNEDNIPTKGKKGKKRKSKATCAKDSGDEVNESNLILETEGEKSKKRKSHIVSHEQVLNGANGESASKKSKKKRKSAVGDGEQILNGVEQENDHADPKLAAEKENGNVSAELNGVIGVEGNQSSKKRKKKCLSHGGDEQISKEFDTKTNDVVETNGSTPNLQKGGKFKWIKTAETLLSQTPEKTLSIKKLKKKVFAEYLSQTSEASDDVKQQLEEKFVSKVTNCEKFQTEGKVIKLVA